jgi:hypothetical protein
MAELVPFRLNEQTIIYIEASEGVKVAPVTQEDLSEGDLEEYDFSRSQQKVLQSFEAIKGTISTYTNYTLEAFREVAIAKVNKVTLEFGIKIGGKAGVPYVTEGTAESNLKITVECSFPEKKDSN